MKTIQSGPVILITGAGKGIGEAVVQEVLSRKQAFLASRQFLPRLFLTSRTEKDLAGLKKFAEDEGLECAILAHDLADDPSKPVRDAVAHFGSLDILVHSAGVGRFNDFLKLTAEDLQFVMKTNVEATFGLLQSTYAQMKKQKSGHLMVVTSVAAEKPFKESAIYCMSKYAQRGLLEVMRLCAYEDGIKITEVKPGAAYTPMWGKVSEEMIAKMMKPREVAQCMVDAILTSPRTSIEEITIRPLQGDFP